MSVLVKRATVLDSRSIFHKKRVDILIERENISKIAPSIKQEAKTIIEGNDVYVSAGWMDMHAQFNDPGYEHKEDLQSGAAAAKNGGFSMVVVSANTLPELDSKGQVDYIHTKAKSLPIDVKVFAALTEGLDGENFTEMFDLHHAGVLGFSDGLQPIDNPDLLKRALLYGKTFGGKIIVYPNDRRISQGAVVHEGATSTALGLKSSPSLSEEIMVARDLAIAEYCNAAIHFMTISTAGAVEQIKRAKRRNIQVTCDVSIANLVWNDTTLEGFDSNFKVIPPLRSERDRKALIKGVNDGTIDAIVTNHNPQNIEEKQCEFDLAAFGQSSIETSFGLYATYLSSDISPEIWVKAVSYKPRNIFGQEVTPITVGGKANLTVFDMNSEWKVTETKLSSKSKNIPILGQTLRGRVLWVQC